MRALPLAALALFVCAAGCRSGSPAPAGAARSVPDLRPLADVTTALGAAMDVRWDGADHVLIADRERGIARLALAGGDSDVQWLPQWPRATGVGSRYMHVGVSPRYIAVADFAVMLRWAVRSPDAQLESLALEYVADLDVHDGRLLLGGLRRDDAGRVATDGAFAWLRNLDDGGAELEPVLPLRSPDAAKNCAGFGLSTVRFLSDGSFLVVPGSEPGAFLYSRERRLRRAWDGETLRVSIDCEMPLADAVQLSSNPTARRHWINQHRVVDEAVDVDGTPAVLVRKPGDGPAGWEMLLLHDSADVERIALPFTGASGHSHLAADYRDGHFVFLIYERLPDAASSRLLVLPWPRSAR